MTSSNEFNGTSFTAGGTLNTGRGYLGGFGTQTATVVAGGLNGPGVYQTATETYDGDSWTTSPATLGTATAYGGGAGTSSAGFVAGGGPGFPTNTEEYNKSLNVFTPAAWASGGNISTARRGMHSSKNGTQNAMFGASGYNSGSSPYTTAATEEYNGSTWTAGGNVINQRYSGTGAGTLTAGLIAGATPSPPRILVEEYDGSTWTAGGAMSTPRSAWDMGCGTQTAAMVAGGFIAPPNTNATEEYDGSTWTAGGNLTDSRRNHSGCGTQTAAVTFAGDLGATQTNQSQEYDGATWTNGATTPTTNIQYMSFGIQTNAVYGGGSPQISNSFTYDGSTISAGASLATGRAQSANAGGAGSGLFASGWTTSPTGPFPNATEEFTGETSTLNIKTLTTS